MQVTFIYLLLLCCCYSVSNAFDEHGWEVSGTISSGTGPVKEVYVQLRRGISEAPISAQTDKRGQYRLSGTEPGKYTLTIQGKENLPSPPTRSLTLQGGSKLVLDVRIPEGRILSGRVVKSGQVPVSGAIVRALLVRRDQNGAVRLSVREGDRTNDRGEFRLPYLAEGRYVLIATTRILAFEKPSNPFPVQPSTSIQTSFYPTGHDFESAVVLDLSADHELSDLTIAVSEKPAVCLRFKVGEQFSGGNVSGTVEDQLSTNGPPLALGALAVNQSYQVCGLTKGEYRLNLNSLTVRDRLFRLIGAQAESADLTKGSVDLGTIEPLGTGTVSGTITVDQRNQNGSGLSSSSLRLIPTTLDLPIVKTIPLQADGSFSDADVTNTEYRLTMLDLPEGYYIAGASQRGRNVLVGGLIPGNGDIQITLASNGATLSGLVLTDDDKPVLDATVFLVPDDSGSPLHVQTDQDGRYSFSANLGPGTYRAAAVAALPEGQRDDSDIARSAAKRGTELDLQSEQRKTATLKISR